MSRIKLTHIITGLSIGGAENVLVRLLLAIDREQFDNSVISLTDAGPLSGPIRDMGIPVDHVGFAVGHNNTGPTVRLMSLLRRNKPDLIQTWMYHADLIGGMAGRIVTSAPVLWNLRQSNFDERFSKPSTVSTANVCRKLSKSIPESIICGSEAARLTHAAMGYDHTKMVVIHNGYDQRKFQRSRDAGLALRHDLGIPDDAVLIGNPSRFDPQKDHPTLFAAFAQTIDKAPNAQLLLCGANISSDNPELMETIDEHGLRSRVHLLDNQSDMTAYYSALDVMCLNSAYGEGAPNVLGEAMLSELPCVATNVGDSAYILGQTGMVVPPRHAQDLAGALLKLVEMSPPEREALGRAGRQRITAQFPLKTMVQRYEDTYRRVYSQRYDF